MLKQIEAPKAVNRVNSEARVIRQKKPTVEQPNSDRPRSLNPLIYPTWWGDADEAAATEQPVNQKMKYAKNTF